MNMKIYLIFFSLITAVTCGKYGKGSFIHAIELCNKYIDDLIIHSVNRSNLDYYPVIGRDLNFYKKVVFYNFKVHANLTEGHITGFGNLLRNSPCALSFENGRIKLSTKLEAKEMKCNFYALVNVIGTTSNASLEAVTSPLKIDVKFAFDASSGRNGTLEVYWPHVISNMNVWVDGLGYLDYVKEPLAENAETLFYDLINTLTYVNLRNALKYSLEEIPFPVKDLEIDDESSTVNTEFPSTTTEGKKVFTKEDSDSYIDIVLGNRFIVESKYSKVDPHILNDVQLDNVFLRQNETEEDLNYIKLEKGLLENLSKLKRLNHCTAPEFRKTNVTFACYLGFDDIQMKYVAEAHNGSQVYNFNLVSIISNSRISIVVTSNYNDNVPTVQNFSVNDLGKISIKAAIDIAGDVYPSPAAIENLYNSKVILKHISDEINSVLKGRLKEVLSYSIFKTPLPFL